VPNTLSPIMAKILARGLVVLREFCIMPQLVNGSYAVEAARKGATIDVPVPTATVADDVAPANVPPVPTTLNIKTVPIQLNNWKKSNFFLSDKDQLEIDRNQSFLPMQTNEAIRALANAVNKNIHDQHWGVFGYVGTAGTTPFNTSDRQAVDVRKVLSKQLCPLSDRRGVLDFDAEANALSLSSFKDYLNTGDPEIKREGRIGRKFGIDWYVDNQVETHTAGTLTGTVTASGATPVGAIVVPLAAAALSSIALKQGDIITFTGDLQTYAVQADLNVSASNTGSVAIYPPLSVALVGGETVTAVATHVVNLVFHRDAFAFANRPLMDSTAGVDLGNFMSMQDPVSGLVMRLEVSRQYKQTVWEFDILWGSALVRPELAARIAG
jgi:P22 coat protein - gene protein 5